MNEVLAKNIYNYSEDEIKKDLEMLFTCKALTPLSKRGLKFINFFTAGERLHTRTKRSKHLNFFEWYDRRREWIQRNYVKRMDEHYGGLSLNDDRDVKKWFRIFALYFGGTVGIFRPSITKNTITEFGGKNILDFTMGWGGRLLGACAAGVETYTGIDSNTNLIEPYKKMVDIIYQNQSNKTVINLIFDDCLNVQYQNLHYDMVFTSPPYYDIEVYSNQTGVTSDKKYYDEHFYKPIIEKTYKYLIQGGHYCININKIVYEKVLKEILGEPFLSIPLNIYGRNINNRQPEYTEFIYVWKKM